MTIDTSTLGPARSVSDLLKFDKFYLFGASAGAIDIESFLGAQGKEIVGFADNASVKHGTLFRGRTVYDPARLPAMLDDQTAIVIASAYQVEIADQLISDLKIPLAQIFPYISDMFQNHFGQAAVEGHTQDVQWLMDRVADAESRRYIENLIAFRWTMDPRTLQRNPCLKGFYDYKPAASNGHAVVGPRKGDRIIDCGAFNGDTARSFLERLDRDCEIIAIEPVSSNYDSLAQWIAKEQLGTKVTPLKIGVGEQRATMAIEIVSDTEDPRATLAHDKHSGQTEEVAIESIDGIVNGSEAQIDYLKIDIEGFEPEALRGAAQVLQRDKPDLAIAGYHKAEHLWELPQLIRQIEPSYRIFVGHHPAAPYECEFFCTARQ